jgi:hypothetical protein
MVSRERAWEPQGVIGGLYHLAATPWTVTARGVWDGGRHSCLVLPLLSSDAVAVEPGFDCYAIVWGVARWGRNAKVLEALDVRDIASRHICMGESLASCFV